MMQEVLGEPWGFSKSMFLTSTRVRNMILANSENSERMAGQVLGPSSKP